MKILQLFKAARICTNPTGEKHEGANRNGAWDSHEKDNY